MHMLFILRHRVLVDTLKDHFAFIAHLVIILPSENGPAKAAPWILKDVKNRSNDRE